MSTKLYVGNLPYQTSESDLQALFESAGNVSSINLVRDRATGQARGFAFVEMADADRCAGGAGTYLIKDFDTSQRIVARKQEAVTHSGADVVATSCPACMIQLKTGLPRSIGVKHIAQVLMESYEAGDRQTGEPAR